MILKPKIVMLDAPSLGLAPKIVTEVFCIMHVMAKERIADFQRAVNELNRDRWTVEQVATLLAEGTVFSEKYGPRIWRELRRSYSKAESSVRRNRTAEEAFANHEPPKILPMDARPIPAPIKEFGAGFTDFDNLDPASIKPPELLYGQFSTWSRVSDNRGAQGRKVGLSIGECVDMALGRCRFTNRKHPCVNVVYINFEDPLSVLQGRVMAAKAKHENDLSISNIKARLGCRLMVRSTIEQPGLCLIRGETNPEIDEGAFKSLAKIVTEHNADVVVVDPLQDASHAGESNTAFRILMNRVRAFAAAHNVAFGLVHHTRKPTPGATLSIDDARGGSAIRGAARFTRLLTGMTTAQATKYGLPEHRDYFMIGDVEASHLPPSPDYGRWFKRISVRIGEASYPTVVPFTPTDVAAQINEDQFNQIRQLFTRRQRAHPNAKDWGGHRIGNLLDIDTNTKHGRKKVEKIISRAIELEFLVDENYRDENLRRRVPVLIGKFS